MYFLVEILPLLYFVLFLINSLAKSIPLPKRDLLCSLLSEGHITSLRHLIIDLTTTPPKNFVNRKHCYITLKYIYCKMITTLSS